MMKKSIYILLLSSAIAFSGCGFKMSGSGKYLPDDLKSIMIPDFENRTTRAEAEQFVTFAVRDEFIKRSAMKLVDNIGDADALLEGGIIQFQARPLSYSYIGSVNQYTVTIVLKVTLINLKTNAVVYENNNLVFTEDYEIESGDFFSQETDALQKISGRFARGVVSSILENY